MRAQETQVQEKEEEIWKRNTAKQIPNNFSLSTPHLNTTARLSRTTLYEY
jgi:hypothetical protein